MEYINCPFCKNTSAYPSPSRDYNWKTADGRIISLKVFRCNKCGIYYVTNPESGAFIAIDETKSRNY